MGGVYRLETKIYEGIQGSSGLIYKGVIQGGNEE